MGPRVRLVSGTSGLYPVLPSASFGAVGASLPASSPHPSGATLGAVSASRTSWKLSPPEFSSTPPRPRASRSCWTLLQARTTGIVRDMYGGGSFAHPLPGGLPGTKGKDKGHLRPRIDGRRAGQPGREEEAACPLQDGVVSGEQALSHLPKHVLLAALMDPEAVREGCLTPGTVASARGPSLGRTTSLSSVPGAPARSKSPSTSPAPSVSTPLQGHFERGGSDCFPGLGVPQTPEQRRALLSFLLLRGRRPGGGGHRKHP